MAMQLVALDRAVIEELVEAKLAEAQALIALLDRVDGDPDAEEDDPSGQCDEDGINTSLVALQLRPGPGCPISDSDREEVAV